MIRFIPHAGEAYSGEPVEYPCDLCGTIGCEHDEPLATPTKSREQIQADYEAAVAHIAAVFEAKIAEDLRFTMELEAKRKAA